MMETKTCSNCGETKDVILFEKDRRQCKNCRSIYKSKQHIIHPPDANRRKINYRNYANKIGARPMSEAKDAPGYLGIYIAERALSRFFDHIERMPNNTPGYDFKCGRGKLIDAKSSCLRRYGHGRIDRWQFSIACNITADYFLCLAFRDRETLEPMHVWLIPGCDVNDKKLISVRDSPEGLAEWAKYERPLDKVIACCTEIGKNSQISAC